MLLGSDKYNPSSPKQLNENLVVLLLNQARYKEAYTLLSRDKTPGVANLFNLALCHFWAENYDEALHCLNRIESLTGWQDAGKTVKDAGVHQIEIKQRSTNDYYKCLTNDYVSLFGYELGDQLIRLKTDCWISLENYSKVMETATQIEYKGYLNIDRALKIAREKLNSNGKI